MDDSLLSLVTPTTLYTHTPNSKTLHLDKELTSHGALITQLRTTVMPLD